MLAKQFFPNPDAAGRDLHQLIIINEFERLLQGQDYRRSEPDGLVRPGRPDIGLFFLLAGIDRHVAVARILPHDHPFINLHPRADKKPGAFLQFVERQHLPDDFLASIESFKARGSSAKVNIALSALPDFPALPGEGPLHRGAISISPSVDYIERAFDDAKYGQVSRRPYIDIIIPSMIDPDMAPPGKHVMSCFVQYAPYDLEGGWNDARREALGEAVISTIEQYAPNIRSAIVGMQVITPMDIEAIAGITGGNIFHGELLLHQIFFLRPAPRWADFRTPLRGYYFGAAGAHPGGGVMGAPGMLAAQEILKDWGRGLR